MLYGVVSFFIGVISAVYAIAAFPALCISTGYPQQALYSLKDYEYDESYWYRRGWYKKNRDGPFLGYPGKPSQRTRPRNRDKSRYSPHQTFYRWTEVASDVEEVETSEDPARSTDAVANLRRKVLDAFGLQHCSIDQQTAFLGESPLEDGKVRVRWISVSLHLVYRTFRFTRSI